VIWAANMLSQLEIMPFTLGIKGHDYISNSWLNQKRQYHLDDSFHWRSIAASGILWEINISQFFNTSYYKWSSQDIVYFLVRGGKVDIGSSLILVLATKKFQTKHDHIPKEDLWYSQGGSKNFIYLKLVTLSCNAKN